MCVIIGIIRELNTDTALSVFQNPGNGVFKYRSFKCHIQNTGL